MSGRVLGRDDLVITGGTLGNPPFRELAEAAAAGGFAGLSLWPGETWRLERDAGRSDAELRRILDGCGLVVQDVDALLLWVGAEPPRRPLGGASEADLFAAGEALGARFVNVALVARGSLDLARAADAFAGVCERAARHGLRPHLEFSPLSAVPDAATALRVVETAGREEGGLLVDTWHVFRGPTTPRDLARLPGKRVLGLQVNDAPAEPMDDPWQETMHHRLAPGAGDIDLPGILRALRAGGCDAPPSVEVFSDALRARYDPPALARHLGDAMRAVLAGAGAGAG